MTKQQLKQDIFEILEVELQGTQDVVTTPDGVLIRDEEGRRFLLKVEEQEADEDDDEDYGDTEGDDLDDEDDEDE